MRSLGPAVAIVVAMLTSGAAGQADSSAESAILLELFGDRPTEEDSFSPQLLDRVSLNELAAAIRGVKTEAGRVERVEARGERFVLITATHEIPAEFALDANGKVTLLRMGQPVPLEGAGQ